ncbi:regulator of ribonuclease activity B [Motilibacter rhizosphaerae]|uniref:Regulator of ribonuclease activity B n=1 Tax=Motilibacter rhizosphaerae TaxID=598652 RepID=A0A4Q7NQJ5_9ACTN|nr:ribonuclease E inhibitor RraB [Motilibacter rhizosphaerae]RZS87493.1 regulator of ribonuclease activity B [Motilibacter rhizosphaerae]
MASLGDRARALLRRRKEEPLPAYVDDGTLPVLGGSSDPAASDSGVLAALAESGVDVTRPLLVRHHLLLPDASAVEQVRAVVAEEGYALVATDGGARASRVEVPSGLALARERTRMAGLAQRLGGDATGWDLCG